METSDQLSYTSLQELLEFLVHNVNFVAVVIILHIYIKSPSYADLLLRGIVREIEIEISRSGVTGQTEMKSRIYDVPNPYPSPTWWIGNCLTTSMVNFIHFFRFGQK
jgi:hypothetical protein